MAIPDIGAYEFIGGGRLSQWDGDSWDKGKMLVYIDGSWRPKQLYRWTGAEWIPVDMIGN